MELIDLPCIGGRFTWYDDIGATLSKSDKFLLSENLISIWKLTCERVGQRDLSYHFPIWLKSGCLDWGLKPFKFNKRWLKHVDFRNFIKEGWKLLKVEGREISDLVKS